MCVCVCVGTRTCNMCACLRVGGGVPAFMFTYMCACMCPSFVSLQQPPAIGSPA